MNNRRIRRLTLAASSALLLAACGLKDDLYIPEPETPLETADESDQSPPEADDKGTVEPISQQDL